MALDVSAGGAVVASLEIPLVLTGVEQARAQLASFCQTGDQAAGRVSAAFGGSVPAITRTASATRNLTATLAGVAGGAGSAGSGMGGLADNVARSATATETHTLASGRLIRAFESLTAEATGANHAILSASAVLGEFAVGNL